MKSNEIISAILNRYSNLCVKYPQASSFVSNTEGTSFYLSQKRGKNKKPVQIRISNHGTYLKTWVDRQYLEESKDRMFDPANCINVSIVFLDEGEDLTYDCKGQQDCNECKIEPCIPQTFEGQNELGKQFKVNQYVYKSKYIASRYINGLTKAIMEARLSGEFKDPLLNLYRASCPKELTSSKQNINCNKTAKKTIILTETQLRQIIRKTLINMGTTGI